MDKQFDELTQEIRNFVNTNNPETADTRAKVASCIFDILNKNLGIKLSRHAVTIKSNYGRRETGNQERERREKFVGDFEAKGSNAEKLVMRYHKDIPSDNLLVALFYGLLDQKIITNLPREATRTKNAIYKFIDDNYDLFKQLFENGTRCEWEKKETR